MDTARQNTAGKIADALLDPNQNLNPKDAAVCATVVAGILSDSSKPDDWERVKRLQRVVADFMGSCVGKVSKDAGHPLDGAAA
jgi:hypothetical protein